MPLINLIEGEDWNRNPVSYLISLVNCISYMILLLRGGRNGKRSEAALELWENFIEFPFGCIKSARPVFQARCLKLCVLGGGLGLA